MSVIDWTDLEQSNIRFILIYHVCYKWFDRCIAFIVVQARRKRRKGNEKGEEWERYEIGRRATLINKNTWTNIEI